MYGISVAPDAGSGPAGPEALVWTETVRPEVAPGEVLVAVTAAGVNRADLLQRQGFYPPPPGASDIIGLECSGTIAEVGEGVDDWSVGDVCVALLAGGGYAEYVAVPAGQVLPPPSGVDPVTAAGLVEVAATVLSNLDAVGLRRGETFLVHGGAGGIGSFAVQYAARAVGATVVATAGSDSKLDRCREYGAAHAFSHRGDWASAVKELGGADVILDPIGAKYLGDHVRLLRRGGRLVTIGMQGGRVGELDLGALLARNGTVTATGLRGRPVPEKAAICAAVRDRIWPLVASGEIRPAPTTVVPIAEAARAHALLESGEASGKVVLAVR